MGKHHQHPHTVSRFFPSPFGSCRNGTVSDIIENSIIPITTHKSIHPVPTIKNKPKKGSAISKTGQIDSGLKGRRCPPLKPVSPLKSSNHKSDVSSGLKNSSSSHSGWFSSEGEEKEGEIDGESDEFYSLSSDSSTSSRRKIRSGSRRRGTSRGSQMGTCPFEVSAISARRSSICRETGKSEVNPCRKNDSNCREKPTPRRKRGESRGSDLGTCPSEVSAISADTSSICRGSGKVEANSGREIGSFSREMHKTRWRRGESRGSETGSCAFEESAISADSGSIGKMKSKSRSKTGGTSRGIVEGADCFLLETEYEGRKRLEIPRSTIRNTDSTNSRQKTTKSFRGTERDRSYQLMGRCRIVMGDGRVKQSYAVEKTSSDPYSDFKESMVDMILEKDIFEDEDLEKLLHCFLSLNSSHHHSVILQVFAEISEAFCSIKSE